MMHNQHGACKAIIAVMELCTGRLTCDLAHNRGSDSRYSQPNIKTDL